MTMESSASLMQTAVEDFCVLFFKMQKNNKRTAVW